MKKYQFAIGLMLFYMLSCTSIKSFKGRTYYDYNEYRVSKLQFDSDSTLTIFNEFSMSYNAPQNLDKNKGGGKGLSL
jgi:hypothetical protein